MLQLEELKQTLLAQQPKIQDLREALGCDKLLEEKKKLDEEAARPDFWNDMENTRRVLKEQKVVNEKLDSYNSLVSMFEDAQTMVELAGEEEFGSEEEQEAFLRDIRDNLKEIDARIEEEKLSALLSGEFDSNNAILTFHAGAGGTEAQDWVQMLYRMYARWAERHGFKVKVLDYLAGEEAGIKSASILIDGHQRLRLFEVRRTGVHRLVRISPFDASGRRHTSFASLEVMPEIDDDYDIEINPADLQGRHLPLRRRGRPARQQDRVGHPHHPHPHRHRRGLPERAQPAPEPRGGDEDAQIQAGRDQGARAPRSASRTSRASRSRSAGAPRSVPTSLCRTRWLRTTARATRPATSGAVMDGDIDGFINAYLKAASQGEI